MKITYYTPAPWVDNGNGLIYGQCSGDDDEAPFVADVCSSPDAYTGQEQANARLIVAAPELLEALQRAYDRGYFDEHQDDSPEEADEKITASAVIAKATGNQ